MSSSTSKNILNSSQFLDDSAFQQPLSRPQNKPSKKSKKKVKKSKKKKDVFFKIAEKIADQYIHVVIENGLLKESIHNEFKSCNFELKTFKKQFPKSYKKLIHILMEQVIDINKELSFVKGENNSKVASSTSGQKMSDEEKSSDSSKENVSSSDDDLQNCSKIVESQNFVDLMQTDKQKQWMLDLLQMVNSILKQEGGDLINNEKTLRDVFYQLFLKVKNSSPEELHALVQPSNRNDLVDLCKDLLWENAEKDLKKKVKRKTQKKKTEKGTSSIESKLFDDILDLPLLDDDILSLGSSNKDIFVIDSDDSDDDNLLLNGDILDEDLFSENTESIVDSLSMGSTNEFDKNMLDSINKLIEENLKSNKTTTTIEEYNDKKRKHDSIIDTAFSFENDYLTEEPENKKMKFDYYLNETVQESTTSIESLIAESFEVVSEDIESLEDIIEETPFFKESEDALEYDDSSTDSDENQSTNDADDFGFEEDYNSFYGENNSFGFSDDIFPQEEDSFLDYALPSENMIMNF